MPGKRAGNDYVNEPPIVGTGPFQTVEVKKGGYIKLVKNPDYWVEGKPTIDELVIAIYQNADTMTQDLKTGAVDSPWASRRRSSRRSPRSRRWRRTTPPCATSTSST